LYASTRLSLFPSVSTSRSLLVHTPFSPFFCPSNRHTHLSFCSLLLSIYRQLREAVKLRRPITLHMREEDVTRRISKAALRDCKVSERTFTISCLCLSTHSYASSPTRWPLLDDTLSTSFPAVRRLRLRLGLAWVSFLSLPLSISIESRVLVALTSSIFLLPYLLRLVLIMVVQSEPIHIHCFVSSPNSDTGCWITS
jgi:hypothetical protein